MIYGEPEYAVSEYGAILSGGTDFTQTCSAFLTVVDLISKSNTKPFTNSTTLTFDILKNMSKSISFSALLSSIITKQEDIRLSTSVSLTELKNVLFNLNKTDSSVLSATLAKTITKLKTDSTSLSFILQKEIDLFRTQTILLSIDKTVSESVSKEETVTSLDSRSISSGKILTDSLSEEDVISLLKSFSRSKSESISLIESNTRISDFSRTFSDSTTISIEKRIDILKQLQDQLSLQIFIIYYFETIINNLETLSLTEINTRLIAFERLISETANIQLDLDLISAYTRSNTESISFSELIDLTKRFSILELIEFAEFHFNNINKNIDTPITIIDERLTPYFRFFYTTVNLSDTKNIEVEFIRRKDEIIDLIIEKQLEYLKPYLIESFSLSEEHNKEIRKDYEENLNITIEEYKNYLKIFLTNLLITEDIHGGGRRWIYDTIFVTDDKSLNPEIQKEEEILIESSMSSLLERALNQFFTIEILLSLNKDILTEKTFSISTEESSVEETLRGLRLSDATTINSLIDLLKQTAVLKSTIVRTLNSKNLASSSKGKVNLTESLQKLKLSSNLKRSSVLQSSNKTDLQTNLNKTNIKEQTKVTIHNESL